MAAQALYRKWRPQTFAEVIGQEHVTRTLRNALRGERVVHAYLFAGPRGTGKTSMGRLLAKAVNCLSTEDEKPCNRCRICLAINEGRLLDLIEIDAASNRGIDEVRDIREKVGFRPNEARYKVYILDEAHMLTEPAFNALLKTLEEPPPHVIFVLVTTEPHKIPATILSRCQRFDFYRLSLTEIVGRLERIATQEGLNVEAAALELIARSATGSMRDAESLLDQLMSYGGEEITLAQVQAMLGTVPARAVSELVSHVVAADVTAGLQLINQVIDEGNDPRQFNKELIEHLRGLLLIKTSHDSSLLNVTAETMAEMKEQAKEISVSEIIRLIRLFNQAGLELKAGPKPQLPLELAFVEATLAEVPEKGPPSPPSEPTESKSVVAPKPVPSPSKGVTVPPREAREAPSRQGRERPAGPRSEEGATLQRVQDNWPRVLEGMRSRNRSVEALLKSCQPVAVEGDTVVLGFYYSFHKGKIEDPRCKALVERVLSETMGSPYRIKCLLSSKDQRPPPEKRPKDKYQAAAEDPLIKAALDKYGARIADVHTPPSVGSEE